MADVQTEYGYLMLATELQDALLLSDFTKHQRAIIDLIIKLSYGCKRRWAIIPVKRHFEIAGVDESVIEKNLRRLEQAKVIERKGHKLYRLQKDYEQWRIGFAPANHLLSPGDTLKELVHINLTEPDESRRGKQSNIFGGNQAPIEKSKVNKLAKKASKNHRKSKGSESISLKDSIKYKSENEGEKKMFSEDVLAFATYLQDTLLQHFNLHNDTSFAGQMETVVNIMGKDRAIAEAKKIVAWYNVKHKSVPHPAYVLQALINKAAEIPIDEGKPKFKPSDITQESVDPFAKDETSTLSPTTGGKDKSPNAQDVSEDSGGPLFNSNGKAKSKEDAE